ncbi:MAG: hypothetical protein H0U20_09690 [Thermoleophilaceae bacterium]|nr:hypothetical protein [Thermoleophilaceae bacterium]
MRADAERCAVVRLAAPFLAAVERLRDSLLRVAAAFLAAAERLAAVDCEPAAAGRDVEALVRDFAPLLLLPVLPRGVLPLLRP